MTRRRRASWPLAASLAIGGGGLGLAPGDAHALPKKASAKKKKKLKGRPGEPGSGVPLDKRISGGDPAKLKAPLPRRPRDDKEAAGMDEMEAFAGRYESAYESMAHTVGQELIVESAIGRHALEQNYEREIRDHEAKARKLRALAITR